MNDNKICYKSKILKNKNTLIIEKHIKYLIFIYLSSKSHDNSLFKKVRKF